MISISQVWIKMKVDNRRRLFTAIDPANAFDARVLELIEIDLQIDLVVVSGLRVDINATKKHRQTKKYC